MSTAPDSVSAPSSRGLWASVKGWPLVLLGLLVAVNALWFGLPRWQQSVRTRKAEAKVTEAAALPPEERGKRTELLRQALEMSPGHPPALRALARAMAEAGNPQTLDVLAALFAQGAATEADEDLLCEAALRWQRPAAAAPVVNRVRQSPAQARSARQAELVTRLLALAGETRPALDVVSAARATFPGPALTLLQAELTAAQPTLDPAAESAQVAEAASLLLPLVEDEKSPASVPAALLLSHAVLKAPASAVSGRDRLLAAALARLDAEATAPEATSRSADARLAAAGIRLKADPAAKPALVQALTTWFDRQSGELQLRLGHWLREGGHFDEVIAWTATKPDALGQAPWFLLRLDALAGASRWEEAAAMLAGEGKLPIPDVTAALFRHRVARSQKADDATLAPLADILKATFSAATPADLAWAAQNLERAGETALALEAYTALTQRESGSVPALMGLVRTLPRTDANVPRLTQALADVVKQAPNVVEAQNDLAWLRLLAGTDTAEATRVAEELHRAAPGVPAFRLTLALARLRAGRAAEALVLCEETKLDWAKAPGPWQAVRAATLRQGDRAAEAERLLAGAKTDGWLAEERRLAGLPGK